MEQSEVNNFSWSIETEGIRHSTTICRVKGKAHPRLFTLTKRYCETDKILTLTSNHDSAGG